MSMCLPHFRKVPFGEPRFTDFRRFGSLVQPADSKSRVGGLFRPAAWVITLGTADARSPADLAAAITGRTLAWSVIWFRLPQCTNLAQLV